MGEIIRPQIVDKVWGHEEIIANLSFGKQGGYCGKRLVVQPGFRSSLHFHDRKDETFRVENGSIVLEIADEPVTFGSRPPIARMPSIVRRVLIRGDVVRVLPGTLHRFANVGKVRAVFVEFSTPDDPDDSIRLEPSGPIP